MTETEKDLAEGLAITLVDLPGVQSAVVCSLQGEVLGRSGSGTAERAAALATFVASRGAALSLEGDLRGMGRLVANSRLGYIAIHGEGADALILAPGPCYAFLQLQRGCPADTIAESASLLLRRFL
jgi:hypothetical protein